MSPHLTMLSVVLAARCTPSSLQLGDIDLAHLTLVIYEKQRKEKTELLKRLLEKGIDLDPIPVLNQVNKLMKKPKFNANVDIRVL
ncbi:hypothetical protein B296_00032993 [Ensete ventricosum]|uniref:Uncharacterized protein n=1 Tax=Ensete ventricosum TaxID=4639 RepID=A0A426ZCT7_ENSVE|nr:hypothetical protein B296_00032993 [Ensete ventricosum]